MSGGGGPGGFGFNDHQVPPPLSGQKRGFPFSGRGGSPDHLDGGSFAKLFVGSVPRTATEEDIRPLFEAHGHVVEVALIRDKKTGEQRGCCFIKYATSEEADRAIRALHNQHTLPGGVSPIQVRYADGERERLGAVEYKLFVGSLNKQATVEEVEEIFSKYGQVEDVYLMRDENKQSRDGGWGEVSGICLLIHFSLGKNDMGDAIPFTFPPYRGCGFVKYSQRDMALAAINALNGNYTMRGCDQPISVRFADPKRPRQGDSRGPAFGGSRFGPRFEAPAGPGPRPPSNFADPMNDRMLPPNAWRAMHPPNMGPSANPGFHNMGPPLLPRSGDMAWPMDAGDPMSNTRGPVDVPFHGQAPPSSMSQQNFNQSVTQMPPVGQQISPLQKPIQSPQDLPPSLHLYPQAPMPYSQMQNSHRQLGQPQLSPAGHPSQQALAISGQLPASQPHVQHTATSAAIPHTPIEISTQSNTSLTTPKQQQFPASLQQQPLQTHQHSPSQLAQMMSQQTQNLQASFHSSQQAFSQIQKQLQMLQPSGQGLTLQQNVETTKKQWAGIVPQAAASTPAAALAVDVSSSNSAASSALTVVNQNTGQVKCNWTEHTSPQGFKYYYNSATGESQWEKPEELELSDQQKQQQTTSVQQSQIQSQPPVQSAQQVPQMWQVQPHGQLQAQVPLQQQILHPSFSSSYQAYGVTGHQSVQEVGSTPLQASVSSVGDSARYPQGIHASQEWMWKTKQAGV